MSNYQRKVNSIVDKIVEGNIEFNNKSINKQDRDKADMTSSILKAISLLNDAGQKLVLDELDVRATRESTEFFDTTGNIDISELTKFTTVIVKSTIEDAKTKGIDLTIKSENKEKDASITKAVLSVVVIDKMLNNFEKLSYEDKRDLINNFKNMTNDQKIKMFSLSAKSMKNLAENAKTLEEKEKFENVAKKDEFFEQLVYAIKRGDLPRLQQLVKSNPDIINAHNEKFPNDPIDVDAISNDNILDIANSIIENDSPDVLILETLYEERERLDKKQPKTKQDEEKLNKVIEEIESIEKNNKIVNYEIKQKDHNQENVNQASSSLTKNSLETTLDESIAKEIANIPIALAKVNFSPEQIKEALSTYKELLVGLNDKDRNKNNNEIYDILCDNVDSMELSESTEDILGIVLDLKYIENDDVSLSTILTNPEKREAFLQEFDKAIEQEINLEQDLEQDEKLDGELEEILNKYFEDNAVEIDTSKVEEQRMGEGKKEEIPITEVPESNVYTNISSLNDESEVENDSENMALEVQDNSFLGKIRRVIANMRDSKNKDNTKGFFSMLKNSIKNVFADKTEDNNGTSSDNSGTSTTVRPTTQSDSPFDIYYKVNVDTREAVRQTEINNANRNKKQKSEEKEEEFI